MPRHAARSLALVSVVLAGCGAVTAPPVEPVSSTPTPAASAGAVTSEVPTRSASAVPVATWTARPDALERIGADLASLQGIADGHGGIRATGTGGYDASVAWAVERLGDLGWDVRIEEAPFTTFRDLGVTLRVGGREFTGPEEARALIYSPSGTVRGEVAVLDGSGCDPAHFAGVPEGAIALTTGGGCFRRDQAVNAADAGMGALVVGYPDRGPGEIFRPTLIDPGVIELPVVSVTGDATRALAARSGETATLQVTTEREPGTVESVVAQLGEGPRVVMVGAHLDSVLDGPGINDNGSGVAATLELARAVASSGVPDGWAVRIGLWGAEEFGTYGSRAHAETATDVVAYLNLDMAGSVNGATLVYDEPGAAPGSEALTEAYRGWFTARGLPTEPVDLGGSSDHAGFTMAGIPTGGLFAGASESGSAAQPGASSGGSAPDPCYHIGCDDLDNVDLERTLLFADATTAVVVELLTR